MPNTIRRANKRTLINWQVPSLVNRTTSDTNKHSMGCEAQLVSRPLLSAGDFDLVLVCDKGSLVGLCLQDYKCLCAAVTICATLVDPKFEFYILTPLTLKSRSNQRWICQSAHACQMHLRCKFVEIIHIISIFCDDLKPSKVGQGDVFLLCDQVHQYVCDARLQVSVFRGYDLFHPMVNTQTDAQKDSILTSLYE